MFFYEQPGEAGISHQWDQLEPDELYTHQQQGVQRRSGFLHIGAFQDQYGFMLIGAKVQLADDAGLLKMRKELLSQMNHTGRGCGERSEPRVVSQITYSWRRCCLTLRPNLVARSIMVAYSPSVG
jgi:hypothetical protein